MKVVMTFFLHYLKKASNFDTRHRKEIHLKFNSLFLKVDHVTYCDVTSPYFLLSLKKGQDQELLDNYELRITTMYKKLSAIEKRESVKVLL